MNGYNIVKRGGVVMAVSDAHKRASVKYNASKDNIMLRPSKEDGARIRKAAADAGKWKQPGRKPHKLPQRSPQLTHERMGVE